MKQKLKWILLSLLGICLAVGIWFSIQRPAYVAEAWNILFSNELTEETIMEENGLTD